MNDEPDFPDPASIVMERWIEIADRYLDARVTQDARAAFMTAVDGVVTPAELENLMTITEGSDPRWPDFDGTRFVESAISFLDHGASIVIPIESRLNELSSLGVVDLAQRIGTDQWISMKFLDTYNDEDWELCQAIVDQCVMALINKIDQAFTNIGKGTRLKQGKAALRLLVHKAERAQAAGINEASLQVLWCGALLAGIDRTLGPASSRV